MLDIEHEAVPQPWRNERRSSSSSSSMRSATEPVEVIFDESAVGRMFSTSSAQEKRKSRYDNQPLLPGSSKKGVASNNLPVEARKSEQLPERVLVVQSAPHRRWEELTRQFKWPSDFEDIPWAIATWISWVLFVAYLVFTFVISPWYAFGSGAAILMWIACWLVRRRRWMEPEETQFEVEEV